MPEEVGDLKVFNPNKEISKEITLEILIRHRDALKQARTGENPQDDKSLYQLADNERKFNQVRALNLVISAQREMITASRPIIYFRSIQKWKKDFKEEEDQKKNPFDESTKDISEMNYDYNKLMFWLGFLNDCARAIEIAERTQKVEDDFIKKRHTAEGEIWDLTENFRDMLEDLEKSYEQIYLLMLTNKIVSAGIEEDEEKTYKEKEEEAIKRIVEA
ncbi:MAG: hypothetical protein ACOC56_03470 [Atribacterota bacterium]